MSRIRGRDTAPEKKVRSLIHRMGYRFRLNVRDLPGKPDVVLPRLHKVIFVHGCVWHGHRNCPRAKMPATNIEFWQRKISVNISRDKKAIRDLRRLGWQILVVWQCKLKDESKARETLLRFLTS